MNQILITRIADNKTFSEESLAELLRDEGFKNADDTLLEYCGYNAGIDGEWYITFMKSESEGAAYDLDPAKYKISFANTLDIERVREMIEEMKKAMLTRAQWPETNWAEQVEGEHYGYHYKDDPYKTIDSIASKYL